jgi:hypothetical protein
MKHALRVAAAAAVAGAALAVQACAAQREWTTHKDPSGFSVSIPAGWRVTPDRDSGRVVMLGPAQEQVVIWPVFLPGGGSSSAAAALLPGLATAAGFGGFTWRTPQPAGATAVRMDGVAGGRAAVAAFAWSSSPRGAAGWAFLTAAPRDAYPEAVFSRILESFRVAGTPGKTAPKTHAFVEWRDPMENAFSVQVPAGWAAEGGLYRFASVDTRSALSVTSPDRKIRITFGDREIPPFVEPNQMLAMAGFREGSMYSPGYGVQFQVRRYLSGVVFAREYVAWKPGRGCSNLTFTENRPRADADQAINQIYNRFAVYGMSVEQQSGEASFTCEENGQPMAGYYFAGTLRTRSASMPGGNWSVQHLFGYLAARNKAQEAQQVIEKIVASVAINPDWARRQQQTTMDTSRIVSETNSAISKIIDDTYWTRQRSQDEISRRRSNAILGVEDVIDPATGREIKVEAGSNYYWIDHRGTIVGTETDTLPSLDFRALTRLP